MLCFPPEDSFHNLSLFLLGENSSLETQSISSYCAWSSQRKTWLKDLISKRRKKLNNDLEEKINTFFFTFYICLNEFLCTIILFPHWWKLTSNYVKCILGIIAILRVWDISSRFGAIPDLRWKTNFLENRIWSKIFSPNISKEALFASMTPFDRDFASTLPFVENWHAKVMLLIIVTIN